MTETVLAVSNLLFGASILGYFYFREVYSKKDDSLRIDKFDAFYSKVMDKQLQTIKEVSDSKDNLTQYVLMEYLKHTEKLEKMVLPQPVTKKAVQEVLNQMPEMVPNDIEKDDKQLEQEQLEDLLSRIPITKDTKVAFDTGEDDLSSGIAEQILNEKDVYSGQMQNVS